MILSSQLLIDNIPMITLKLHGNFFFFDEQMKALKIKKKKVERIQQRIEIVTF